MNYIGSKYSLLDFLECSINAVTGNKPGVFCDLFAGTGAVGAHFKKLGYKVVANDIQYYSYVLNRHYIGNNSLAQFRGLKSTVPGLLTASAPDKAGLVCAYLNTLAGVNGFIFQNYCLGGTMRKKYRRQYLSDDNGRRCDAIRLQIEEWRNNYSINEDEYFFLLASLIESIDKRANTASVYGAFLKHLKKTAQQPLTISAATTIPGFRGRVFNEDINSLIRSMSGDILYLDPPYNQRQYATNYHLLETVAKYDDPRIFGKTGLREYTEQKSAYCSRTTVKASFSDLIERADVRYIFLSYNNEGLMTPRDVEQIMSRRGKYGIFKKKYRRFKADTDGRRNHKADHTFEYLHYVVVK